MGFEQGTSPFDVFQEEGVSSLDAEAESGDGGDTLGIFFESYSNQLDMYASPTTNESSYPTPGGFVNTRSNPFDTDQRVGMGQSMEGASYNADREPQPGSVVMRDNDDELLGSGGNPGGGIFVTGTPAISDIEAGSNVAQRDFSAITINFFPESDGLQAEDSGTYPRSSNLTFNYGRIEGEVTDVTGDPVEGEILSGLGGFAETHRDGSYTLEAPAGTRDVRATSMRLTKSAGVQEFEETTLNFQYSGLRVEIILPDDTPVVGAPVFLGAVGESRRTRPNGRIEFQRVPVNEPSVLEIARETPPRTIQTGGEAALIVENIDTGWGITGQVRSSETGNAVANVDVSIDSPGEKLVFFSDDDGRFTVFGYTAGDTDVTAANTDRRYVRADDIESVTDGDVLEGREFFIDRRTALGTFR